MDANTTVAIDILIRTSMGNAGADFNKALARMESDAKAWANRMNAIFASVKMPSVSAGVAGGKVSTGSSGGGDPAMRAAMADIARMQAQRQKMESDYTTFVTNQAEKQYRARAASLQKGAAQFQAILDQEKKAQAAAGGGGIGSALSSIFGGGAVGNIAAGVAEGNALIAMLQAGVQWTKELGQELFNLGEESVQDAAKFQVFTNSVAVFSGSVASAKIEIADLDTRARNTPGLGLETAEEGYQRLRALNFQADLAQKLIIGLGKIKLVSGATDQGVDRVIMHLTQLSVSTNNASRDIRFMIRDLPGMKQALLDAFGTIEPKGLKAMIDANPQDFFEKLADSMVKTKVAQPGLTAGFVQLQNAFLQAKRVFAEPLLDPLTRAVKFFTDLLDSNQNRIRDFGDAIANDISTITTALESGDYATVGETIAGRIVDGIGTGLGALTGVLGKTLGSALADAVKGEDFRRQMTANAQDIFNLLKQGKPGAALSRGVIGGLESVPGGSVVTSFLGGITGTEDPTLSTARLNVRNQAAIAINKGFDTGIAPDMSGVFDNHLSPQENERIIEKTAIDIADIRKGVRDTPSLSAQLQAEKATEEVNKLAETQRKLALTQAQGGFNIAQAQVNLNPSFLPTDTITNTKALLNAQENFISAQIKNQKDGYDAEIDLNKDDATKVKTLETEKQIAIKGLTDQRVVQELAAQKAIEDAERESSNRRRQAAIEFYGIQLNTLKQAEDAQLFAIQKALNDGRVSAQQAATTEITIENDTYTREVQLLRATLALQLQDRTKTAEELSNLRATEQSQEQQSLLEHQKKLADIEKGALQDRRDVISQQMDIEVKTIESATTLISTLLEGVFGEHATSSRINSVYLAFTAAINTEIAANEARIESIADRADKLIEKSQSTPVTVQVAPPQAPIAQQSNGSIFNPPAAAPGVIYDAITGQILPDTGATTKPLRSTVSQSHMSAAAQAMFGANPPTGMSGAPDTPQAITATGNAADKTTGKLKELADFQNFLFTQNDKARESFNALTAVITNFGGTAEDVDKLQAASLKADSEAKVRAIDIQINAEEQLLHLTKDDKQRIIEEAKLSDLEASKRQAVAEGLKSQEEAYRKSIVGLTEYNKALAEGDKDATAFAQNAAIKDRLTQEAALREKIIALKDQEANGGTLRALQVEAAGRQSLIDLDQKETDAIIAMNQARVDITQQTVYSGTQANAAVLRFMADQKGVTQTMADFKIGLISSGYDLIDRGLDKVIPKMGLLHDTIRDMLSSFIKLALNSAFRKLFGLDGAASSTSGGGKSGGGIGGFLSGLFGGGGSSSSQGVGTVGAGTIFSGASASSPGIFNLIGQNGGAAGLGGFGGNMTSAQAASIFGGIVSGGAPDQITSGGAVVDIGGALSRGQTGPGTGIGLAASLGSLSKSGLGQFLGSPLLGGGILGAGLGAGLGQGSITGTILGGLGGAALGIGATAGILGATTGVFATGGALASLAPLAAFFTNPFTIGIGAALLVGALIFGHAARAKKEKKQVNTWSDDAVTQIQTILTNVKDFKISGADGLSQATAIRDQFAQNITQLKDKGAKSLAQDKLAQINSLLGQVKTEGDRADRMSTIAQVTDDKIVPTFDVGGFTGFGYGYRPALLDSSEVVLRKQDIMAMGGYRRLQNAGVKGMPLTNSWGQDRPTRSNTSSGASSGGDTYAAFFMDEGAADEWLKTVSPMGMANKVKVVHKGNLAGVNDVIASKLSGN